MLGRQITSLLIVLTPNWLYAQAEPSKEQARKEFEAELAKMKAEKPGEYERGRRISTLSTEMLLGRLGYGVGNFDGEMDEILSTALRKYQRQRGIPVTGDPLSYDTFEQVEKDTKSLDRVSINLPNKHLFLDLWDSGYASATGTWIILNDQQAWPQQTSQIACQMATRTCSDASAIFDSDGNVLSVYLETYDIERWDAKELVTKPRETGIGCVRYVLRINRVQQSVTGVRSTVSRDELCKGASLKDLNLELVDGLNVRADLDQAWRVQFQKLMQVSPEVWQSLK